MRAPRKPKNHGIMAPKDYAPMNNDAYGKANGEGSRLGSRAEEERAKRIAESQKRFEKAAKAAKR